jgi:hypothetical protein
LSSQPIRVDDSKPQDTLFVHSGGGAVTVHRRNKKWLYIGIATLLALLALLAAYSRIAEEIAFIRAMAAHVFGFPLVITDVTKDVQTAVSNPVE